MKLKLENVNKKFGTKQVLNDITFEIDGNRVVGLLGPNGAGKTTIMRIICGFYGLSAGKVYWNDKKAEPKSNKFKSKVGYLPENNPLYPGMTVGEYLEFIGNIKGIPRDDLTESIRQTAKDCGLDQVMSQKIEVLSKGYKQRVGLAAAILGDPELLVLDEPTSGLDPNQIIEIRDLIKKLSKEKVVLLSTHILPEAKAICEQLLIINRGKIVLDEKTNKIKNLEKKFIELTV